MKANGREKKEWIFSPENINVWQHARFTVSKSVMAKTSGCGFGGIFGKQGNRESIGIVEGAIVSLDIKLKQ